MLESNFVKQLLLGEVSNATVYWVKKGICYCIDMATEDGSDQQQRIASIMKETILRNGATTTIITLCDQILDQVNQLNLSLTEVNNNVSNLIIKLSKMVSEDAYYNQIAKVNVYARKYDSCKDTGGLIDEVNALVETEKKYVNSLEEGQPVNNEYGQNFAHIYGAKIENLKWVTNVTYKEKIKQDGQTAYEVNFEVCDPTTIMESIAEDARNLYANISPYKINNSNQPEFVVDNNKCLFDYAYDYCENYFVTEAQYTDFYNYQLSYAIGIVTNMLLYLRFYFEFWNASDIYNNTYSLYATYQDTYNTLVNAIIGTCNYVDVKVGSMMRSYDIKQKITMKYKEKHTLDYNNVLVKGSTLIPQFTRMAKSITSKANKTQANMEFCKINIVGDSSYLVLNQLHLVTERDMGIEYHNDIKGWADEHYFLQSADYMNLLETQSGDYSLGKWQEGGTSSDVSAYFGGKSPCIGSLASWLADQCDLGSSVPNAVHMLLPYYKQNRPKANTPAPMVTAYFSDEFYWQNVTNLSLANSFPKRDEIKARSLVEDDGCKNQPLLVILPATRKQQYSLIGGTDENTYRNVSLELSRSEQFYPNDIIHLSGGNGYSYVESGCFMYLKVSRYGMTEGVRVVLASASTGEELTTIASYEDFEFNNCGEKIFRFRMPYQETKILCKKC